MSLIYRTGDVLKPEGFENKIIGHICNNRGVWGGGLTKALSLKWKQPEREYRRLTSRPLGKLQIVRVSRNIQIANIIVQVYKTSQGPPIRYEAIEQALKELNKTAREQQASITLPRIGCALAGGCWEKILPLIDEHLVLRGRHVHIYTPSNLLDVIYSY